LSDSRPPQENVSQYVTFVQRIGLAGVARAIFSLKGLIILPILTKTLGASDYGIWAQILVTVSLLQPFISLGIGSSTVRFLSSRAKREIGQGIITALSVIVVTSLVVALVIFFLSDFIAGNLLRDESVAIVVRIASSLIILEALNAVALGSFRIFGQIKRYSTIMLLQAILEVSLIAFFVLSGYGLLGAIISLIVTKGIILLIILYLIISYAGFAYPNISLVRPYLAYGLPMAPTAVFTGVVESSDRYVISFYMGAASVGIYSAAYSIGSIISMFLEFIAYILAPTVYNLFDRGRVDEVKNYFSYSLKYLMMFSIPAGFGVSILAEPLLSGLTTAEFVSTGRFIIPLIALSMVLYGVHAIFGMVVTLSKRTIVFTIAFGVGAAINLGLNILLVPHWGVMTAAITTVLAYLVVVIIMYYQAGKYLKFDPQLDFVIKSILSSAVMTLVIWAINPVGITGIILSIAIGAFVYFAVLFSLRGLKREEIKFVLKIFKVGKLRK
jgi:O-antigen/teichoic acid export membrane protein